MTMQEEKTTATEVEVEEIPTRVCQECKRTLPVTEFYSALSRVKICKDCNKIRGAKVRAKKKERSIIPKPWYLQ